MQKSDVEIIEPLESYVEKYKSDIAQIVHLPIMQKIYHLYDLISHSIRKYLDSTEFLEYKAPIIGPVTDPGIRGAKQIELQYYERTYKFMSSAILYKQLLASSRKFAGEPGKIYFFADNLRLEPLETVNTDRHLTEFIQVDVELTDEDHFGAMKVAEGMVKQIYLDLKREEKTLNDIWSYFSPYWEERGLKSRFKLKVPQSFKKYEFTESIDLIKSYLDEDKTLVEKISKIFKIKPSKLDYKRELSWEYEWLLSYKHEEPFFICDYPKGVRGFYDREYPNKIGTLMDFDLLYPHGYGEAISGAAREYQIEKIIPRMKESGESLQKYEWYLKFLKEHGQPTSGFGIGLERATRYFGALPKIYLSSPYPKIPGVYSP